MCDPGTIAGLILTAAGTAIQMSAQQQAASAMKKARLDEYKRQEEMRKKGQVQVENTSDELKVDAMNESQALQEADLSQQYKASTANLAQTAALPGQTSSAPSIIDATKRAALERTLGSLNQTADARANLNSFGRALWDKGFDIADTAHDINLLNDARRGSINVLDFELQNAAAKAQSPIGDILTGIGGSIGPGAFGGRSAAAPAVISSVPLPRPNPRRISSVGWGL